MILHCTYEELQALRAGALLVLSPPEHREGPGVPPPTSGEERAAVDSVLAELDGDLSVETLTQQRHLLSVFSAIVNRLRVEMEARVTSLHPAAEDAVQAYFEFAHALKVLERLREIGREMEAILGVVADEDAGEELADTFVFPD